jgi:TetR/AcrR family transcriptional repressor of uid operon
MIHAAADPVRPDARATQRHDRILDAAAACFAASGFHRTTMQDVAAKAGMSPGNLYRYFPSKDALIAGMVERDRAEVGAAFATASGDDLLGGLRALGRRTFLEDPRDKSTMCVQIWAEATRDPTVAALHQSFEADLANRFVALFEAQKAKGGLPASLNSTAAARIIMKLANGLFVRRAAGADFNPEQEIAEVFAVIEALLDGTVKLPNSPSA